MKQEEINIIEDLLIEFVTGKRPLGMEGSRCKYRTSGGGHCAVGAMINPSHPNAETIFNFTGSACTLVSELNISLVDALKPEYKFLGDHLDLLQEIQNLHDNLNGDVSTVNRKITALEIALDTKLTRLREAVANNFNVIKG